MKATAGILAGNSISLASGRPALAKARMVSAQAVGAQLGVASLRCDLRKE